MRVLATGFEPFGGHEVNPSGLVLRALDLDAALNRRIRLRTAVLPVSFARAPVELARLTAAFDPDLVLSFGLAAKATAIRVERWAAGHNATDRPDNDGVVGLAGSSDRHGASVPVDAILAALAAADLPAAPSDDAGGYVCNALFFAACAWSRARTPPAAVGFIHLPPAAAPGFDQQRLDHAARIVLGACI